MKFFLKDGFRQLHANFSPILEDLGRTRADEINATCELSKSATAELS